MLSLAATDAPGVVYSGRDLLEMLDSATGAGEGAGESKAFAVTVPLALGGEDAYVDKWKKEHPFAPYISTIAPNLTIKQAKLEQQSVLRRLLFPTAASVLDTTISQESLPVSASLVATDSLVASSALAPSAILSADPETEIEQEIDRGVGGAGDGVGESKDLGLAVPERLVLGGEDSTDALAKTDLLHNSLQHFPDKYQSCSLLHGANLYVNNIINGLYVLLVAARPEVRDGNVFITSDEAATTDPLGQLLAQLFYRHGNVVSPTGSKAALAFYLTPMQWGQMYAASFDIDKFIDLIRSFKPKKVSWPQFDRFLNCYRAFFSAKADPHLAAQRDLARSIIMAFVWAKFVIKDDISVAQARQNLALLYDGIKNIKYDWAKEEPQTSRLSALEDQVIKNINLNYTASLPKPPVQGKVTLADGNTFPDCGESCWRGLFLAAFYQANINQIVVPTHEASNFYDPVVVDYFKRFSILGEQNTPIARDMWGQIISYRPNISYFEDGYDVQPEFTNMMCLLAQLVPGSYQKLLVLEGQDINLSPASIYDYLHDNLERAEKLLTQFAADHELKLFDFKKENHDIKFKLRKTKGKKKDLPMLVYSVEPSHMDCTLKLNIENNLDNSDPLIAYNELNLQAPIIFAAYDIANNGFFKKGYLALLQSVSTSEIDYIINNIKAWKMLRPEDQKMLNKPAKAAFKAYKLGLMVAFDILIDKVDYIKASQVIDYDLDLIKYLYVRGLINADNINEVLAYATYFLYTDPAIIEFLLDKGADVNYVQDIYGNKQSPLERVVFNKNIEIVALLLARGADVSHIDSDLSFLLFGAEEEFENIEQIIILLHKHGVDFKGRRYYPDLAKHFSKETKDLFLAE